MKHGLALLLALAALTPIAGLADQTSATINAFTAEQAIDCLTTMAVLRGGGYERDPLAVPFTRSTFAELGAATALNIAARHMPVRILRTVVNVYPVILVGNVRALGAMSDVAGMVPGGVTQANWPGRTFHPRPRP